MTLHDLRAPPRPFPVALAQELARTKPGDARLKLLNDLYRRMTPADQLRVRAELLECQRAKRCQMLAEVRP